jgi:hypothetical protein
MLLFAPVALRLTLFVSFLANHLTSSQRWGEFRRSFVTEFRLRLNTLYSEWQSISMVCLVWTLFTANGSQLAWCVSCEEGNKRNRTRKCWITTPTAGDLPSSDRHLPASSVPLLNSTPFTSTSFTLLLSERSWLIRKSEYIRKNSVQWEKSEKRNS